VRLRLLTESWPPLLAWAGALGSLWLVAALWGHDPWASGTWAHWDSAHYESIARGGYDVHRCVPGETDNGGKWCGNAAWFPGYPALIAALHVFGLPIQGTAVALSWLFAAAALVLLWHTFLRGAPKAVAAGGLLYAAWAPGQIYDYTVFPLSMLFFFTVAYLHFLRRGRWPAAGLAGAAAVLTYPIGVTLAVVGIAWIALTVPRGRLRAVALSASPSPAAFLGILAAQRVQTGRWTAFFDVERQYGHGFHDPFGTIWNALLVLERSDAPLYHGNAGALQTLVVCAVLAAVLLHAAFGRSLTRLDLLFVIWAVVTWVLPLTQANVSIWRSQAALAPLAVLVARLPRPLLVLAVAAVVAVSVPAARLFFEGRLI